jgi:hypothetical protein
MQQKESKKMWLKLLIIEDKSYGKDESFETNIYMLINMDKIIYIHSCDKGSLLRYDIEGDGNYLIVKESLKEIERAIRAL